jgi:hypothetical protein
MILRRWIDPGQLPDEMAISSFRLAELSAGPHEVRASGEQDRYDEHAERARAWKYCSAPRVSSTRFRSALKRPASSGALRQRLSPQGASHVEESPTCSSQQQPSPRDCRCSRPTPVTSPAWTPSCPLYRSPAQPSSRTNDHPAGRRPIANAKSHLKGTDRYASASSLRGADGAEGTANCMRTEPDGHSAVLGILPQVSAISRDRPHPQS